VTRRFRVAIVGAGIGAEHLAGYLACPDLFEPAVICDLDADRAGKLAERSPGCAVSTSFDEIVSDRSIDVVDICLPPSLHLDFIKQALSRGKQVVCEKPLVSSLADLDEVEAHARQTGRLVLPVYQYRFGMGLGKLRHLISEGLAGKPFVGTIETHWNRGAGYYAVPWRGKYDTELGGACLGHAIHAHDMLTFAIGRVVRVHALADVRVNAIETEDCAAIVFEMENGALVTSSVTLGSADEISRFRLCFSEVTAESGLAPYKPASEPWRFTSRDPERQGAIDDALGAYRPHSEGFARMFELFHAALAGTGPLPVTIEDARISLELVTAIYQSAATKTPAVLPLGRDHPAYRGWPRL
jgi:predicted dehydrogenase